MEDEITNLVIEIAELIGAITVSEQCLKILSLEEIIVLSLFIRFLQLSRIH